MDEIFDPFEKLPLPNQAMVYLGACLIAGIRLAREKQVNIGVIPTIHAIDESIDVAWEVFAKVFRKVPHRMEDMPTDGRRTGRY